MEARFHTPLNVIAFNVNGIAKQRYELSKQLQYLHFCRFGLALRDAFENS
jgi:hypothetical protein